MAKIVGIETVNYTSKKTGNPVSGYRVHVIDNKPDCYGETAENVFINSDNLSSWVSSFKTLNDCIGHTVRLRYNRFGNCDGLEEL